VNHEFDNLDNEKIEIVPSSSTHDKNLIGLYLNIAKRNILLILVLSIIGFIPAFLLSKKDPITYVGNFQLLLEPVSTEEKLTDASTLTRARGTVDNDLLNLDYPTILTLLRSSFVLSRVAEKVHKKYPDISEELVIRLLKKKLVIDRHKAGKSRFDTTKIIEITFTGTDPQLVDIILENTADTFLEYSTEEREKTLTYGVSFINEQIPKLRSEIKSIQEKQKRIQLKYQIVNPKSQSNALFENKIVTEQNLEKTSTELEELKILASKLEEDLGLSAEESLIASNLNEDPQRQLLVSEIKKIEAEIARESATFTNEFPNIKNLQEKLRNLKELLEQKNQEIIAQENLDINKINPNIFNYQDRNKFDLIKI